MACNAYSDPRNLLFWGFNPQILFSLLRPLKGTSLAGNTRFEPSLVTVGRAVRLGRREKYTNKKAQLSLTNPRDAYEKFARFM